MSRRNKDPQDKDIGKSRIIRLLLYPDDATHEDAINKILSSDWEYAYILHKDELVEDEEEEEVKKDHYHFVLRFKNQRHIGGIAKELGIAENYVRLADNLIGSLQYLIHFNHDDKKQYAVDDVGGSLKKVLADSIERIFDTEEDRARRIIDKIWSDAYCPSCTEIARWACDNGLWSDLRRGYSIFGACMSERRNLQNDFEFSNISKKINKAGEKINFEEFTVSPLEFGGKNL